MGSFHSLKFGEKVSHCRSFSDFKTLTDCRSLGYSEYISFTQSSLEAFGILREHWDTFRWLPRTFIVFFLSGYSCSWRNTWADNRGSFTEEMACYWHKFDTRGTPTWRTLIWAKLVTSRETQELKRRSPDFFRLLLFNSCFPISNNILLMRNWNQSLERKMADHSFPFDVIVFVMLPAHGCHLAGNSFIVRCHVTMN